jgi:hypothetical protein
LVNAVNLMFFFYKNQSATGHVHILSNQQLTCGVVIFLKKPMFIFSDTCDLDDALYAGPTCQWRKDKTKLYVTIWNSNSRHAATDSIVWPSHHTYLVCLMPGDNIYYTKTFFEKGAFITQKAITSSLCITKMHTPVLKVSSIKRNENRRNTYQNV